MRKLKGKGKGPPPEPEDDEDEEDDDVDEAGLAEVVPSCRLLKAGGQSNFT